LSPWSLYFIGIVTILNHEEKKNMKSFRPTSNVQRPTSNVQRPTSNVQRPTSLPYRNL